MGSLAMFAQSPTFCIVSPAARAAIVEKPMSDERGSNKVVFTSQTPSQGERPWRLADFGDAYEPDFRKVFRK